MSFRSVALHPLCGVRGRAHRIVEESSGPGLAADHPHPREGDPQAAERLGAVAVAAPLRGAARGGGGRPRSHLEWERGAGLGASD